MSEFDIRQLLVSRGYCTGISRHLAGLVLLECTSWHSADPASTVMSSSRNGRARATQKRAGKGEVGAGDKD
jgi:hypothetical protein